MQLTPQEFLPLAEKMGAICFWDLETTGREADYHSILCSSVKPYRGKPKSCTVVTPGKDRSVVEWTEKELSKYLVWVTYFGKGFDYKFFLTREVKHKLRPIEKRLHYDAYWTARNSLLTGRKSQAHLLRWLGGRVQKMDVDPDMWNQVLADPVRNMPTIQKRCESDTAGLECLYDSLKWVVKDITR